MWKKGWRCCNHNDNLTPAAIPKQKSYMPWIYPPHRKVVSCCQVLVLQRLVVTIGGPGDWVLKSLWFLFKSMGSMGSERYIYRSISNFFMNQMWENDHENTGILWFYPWISGRSYPQKGRWLPYLQVDHEFDQFVLVSHNWQENWQELTPAISKASQKDKAFLPAIH